MLFQVPGARVELQHDVEAGVRCVGQKQVHLAVDHGEIILAGPRPDFAVMGIGHIEGAVQAGDQDAHQADPGLVKGSDVVWLRAKGAEGQRRPGHIIDLNEGFAILAGDAGFHKDPPPDGQGSADLSIKAIKKPCHKLNMSGIRKELIKTNFTSCHCHLLFGEMGISTIFLKFCEMLSRCNK